MKSGPLALKAFHYKSALPSHFQAAYHISQIIYKGLHIKDNKNIINRDYIFFTAIFPEITAATTLWWGLYMKYGLPYHYFQHYKLSGEYGRWSLIAVVFVLHSARVNLSQGYCNSSFMQFIIRRCTLDDYKHQSLTTFIDNTRSYFPVQWGHKWSSTNSQWQMGI